MWQSQAPYSHQPCSGENANSTRIPRVPIQDPGYTSRNQLPLAQARVPYSISHTARPHKPSSIMRPSNTKTLAYQTSNLGSSSFYTDASSKAMPRASHDQDNTTTEDIKSFLRDRLPQGQPGSGAFKGYIRGAADFQHQFRQYLSLSFRPAAFAEDFPDNDEALRKLAKGITDAMLDMDGAVEAGQKSVTRIYQLSPYEVELKSWEFLFVLRDVQLGRVGLPGWGKLWTGEDFDCFMDRYNDAVSKLHVSKSIVSSLFDQDFSVRLALAPAGELKKKIANMNNNARRAVELAMVRGMKQRKQAKGVKPYDSTKSRLVSTSAEDVSPQQAGRLAGSKRLHPQNYSTVEDDMPIGGRQIKRVRTENAYTPSIQTDKLQDFTHLGSGNGNNIRDICATSKWARADSLSPGLFVTPGLTPSSELADSTGFTGSPGLPDPYDSAYAAPYIETSNVSKPDGFGMNQNSLVFQGLDEFNSTGGALTLDTDWMNDLPDETLLFDTELNLDMNSEALSFDPELGCDMCKGAVPEEPAQVLNWTSSDLNLDIEMSSGLPLDTLMCDEAVETGEAFSLHQEQSFDLNVGSSCNTFNEIPDLEDALFLEPLRQYNENAGGDAVRGNRDLDGPQRVW